MLLGLKKKCILLKWFVGKMKKKGYEVDTIGINEFKGEDVKASSDLDFYNFIIFKNKRKQVRVDFDVVFYDFNDIENWIIDIVKIKKQNKRKDDCSD